MPSASDVEIILADDIACDSSSSYSDGEDMFVTIDTLDGDDFPAIERPRALVKKESLQKEKQISVDPVSLMGSTIREASFTLVSTPPKAPKGPRDNLALPHPPPKLKFVSASLPSSASSSPHSGSSLSKKIWESHNKGSLQPLKGVSPQRSAMDDTDLALQENMRRSKSEGEGRASVSADDFEIMLEKPSMRETMYEQPNSFSKPPVPFEDQSSRGKRRDIPEDGFKCGKLCLFLPRGKGRTVRASSSSSISFIPSQMSPMPSRMSSVPSHNANRMSSASSNKTEQMSPLHPLKMDPPVISKRVSLERFDLGSFSSSVISDGEAAESTNLFFDLPLELIRCSVSDMQSPVTAAFVFDKDAMMEGEPKGRLKSASPSTDIRKSMSQESYRQVRFSTSSATSYASSPTCISPRQKAREDFNTFLEAQST